MTASPSFQEPNLGARGRAVAPLEAKAEESRAGVLTGDCIHFPQERSDPVMVMGWPVKLMTLARTCRYSYMTFGSFGSVVARLGGLQLGAHVFISLIDKRFGVSGFQTG